MNSVSFLVLIHNISILKYEQNMHDEVPEMNSWMKSCQFFLTHQSFTLLYGAMLRYAKASQGTMKDESQVFVGNNFS